MSNSLINLEKNSHYFSKVTRLINTGTFRLGLSLTVSGLALYLALHDVDLVKVGQALGNAQAGYVGLALISVMVNVLSKASRWQVLIGGDHGETSNVEIGSDAVDTQVGFSNIFKALMVGQMLNWVFPARIGDISRIYVIGRMGPGRSFVLGTVALEKVLDVLAYALLFLGLLLVLPLPIWISESGYYLTVLAVLLLFSVVILAKYQTWFVRLLERITVWMPEKIRVYLIPRVQKGLGSLGVMRRISDLLQLGLWSILVWGTAVWTNHLIAQALGLDISWTAAIATLVVLQVGISFSQVPGMVGIFQYACILTLAIFGVDQVYGLSYGILLHITVMLPIIILGLFFFWQLELKNVKWHE